MKRKTLLILLFIFSGFIVNAQNEANIWHFGMHGGLDFNTGVPVVIPDVSFGTFNASASISDSMGNLLFSCNSQSIWNRNGQLMQNGESLIGNQGASQGTMILQKPGSGHIYYVFTIARFTHPIGMHYSIVNMNLEGGLGAVTVEKNISLDAAWDALEKLTSVRHANGYDIWILTRKFTEDAFASFLLTSSGLNTVPVLSQRRATEYATMEGSMKISPDKKYLVVAYADNNFASKLHQAFDICSFNSTTGEVSLLYTLTRTEIEGDPIIEPWAVEFSPDSKLLYLTSFNESIEVGACELFQYDMQYVEDSLQFKQSGIHIATGPVNGLQLARDGKIYCSGDNLTAYDYISLIDKPWKRGTDCNFKADAIYMGIEKVGNFLPNILLDYLFRFEWAGECAGNPITFQPNFIPEPTSIFWSFGDGNISTALWPVHIYEQEGEHEVFVRVTYPSGRIEETSRVITVLESPNPDLGLDTLACEGAEITLTAGSDTGMYFWSNGSFGENIFSITVSDTGTYWVKVTNSNGCSLSDSIHFGWYKKAVFNEDNLVITPTSCGGSNGSIVGLQPEGFEPLSYEWYDGDGNMISTNLDIANLLVGYYFLHVLDSNYCITISEAYTITDAGDILITAVYFSASHCLLNSGAISITASSGAGSDFSYSIDNGNNWQSSNLFENLPIGNYFVKVNDPSGCETVYENNPVVIENIEGPEITDVNVVPETDYSADGQIDISATITDGDLYYSIDDGNSFQTNTGLFTGLTAGIYPCVVKDEFGCDTTFTIELDRIISQLIGAIAGDGNTCIGDATASQLRLNNFVEVDSFHVKLTYNENLIQCDGYVQVHPDLEDGFQASIIPALGEVHITWKGQSPVSLPEHSKMTELVFSGIDEGVSQIDWIAEPGEGQFFNDNGEIINVAYELGAIRIYTRPKIIMGTSKEACEGDTIIISPFVTGGSGEADYVWRGPDNFYSTNDFLWLNTITPQQAGTYSLTVTDTIDCVESKEIEITVNHSPAIAFSTYDTIWAEPGYLLEAGNGVEYYLWNTGEITEAIQIDSTGQYVVEVISYEGCKSSDAVQILWGGGTPFYMPNAFTPNNDGLNDVFKAVPKYDYVSKYQLTIYNRWGQQIFECNDIDCGWDGTYQGDASPNGVYIYRIVYEEISQPGQSKTVEGTVVLVG